MEPIAIRNHILISFCRHNDDPSHASMPFDTHRSGPVMSDGGGLLVLESLESALTRIPRPKIYCEIGGYMSNCDAYHIMRPKPTGEGKFKCAKAAMIEAKVVPSMVGKLYNIYINKLDSFNTHAASSLIGDQAESHYIKAIMGD